MTLVFGLPLFGNLFIPFLIGVLTTVLFKIFYSATLKGGDHVKIEQVQVANSDPPKDKIKQKKKKSCSGKKGSKGCCSTKNGLIDITRVFVETSPCSKILSESLVDLWRKNNFDVEVIPLNSVDLEAQLLNERSSISLCAFLLDKNEEMPILKPWLENLVNASPAKGDILSGLKYSVFIANGVEGDTIHHETDRAIHRLGGVRACKAETVDFTSWLECLTQKVRKWNESGKKGCKCGPDDTNEVEGEESSCSGNCSSSEDEAAPARVLDLEDLGKALS